MPVRSRRAIPSAALDGALRQGSAVTHKLKGAIVALAIDKSIIPPVVKVFTALLIVAGLFFAYVFTFNPGLAFPGAKITDYSSQMGFMSTGVRVLGSVVGLAIALVLNSPRLLWLMLITRLVIEVGDIFVGFATGGTTANAIMIGTIALLELLAVIKLSQVIRAERA